VLFYVLFVCKCVLYYCHRLATLFAVKKYIISYHIIKSVNLSETCAVGCFVGLCATRLQQSYHSAFGYTESSEGCRIVKFHMLHVVDVNCFVIRE